MRFRLTAAACMVLLAGCRTPLPSSSERIRELRTVEENRVVALLDGGTLVMRFRLKGRDAYATASLPDNGTETRAALEFSEEAKDRFSAARKRRRAVPVLGPAAWHAMSREVAAMLAPASARQCTLVATGGQELLACRSATGAPMFKPLTERSRDMKITRRVTGSQLVEELAAALDGTYAGAGPVLILTGESPALLLLDPRTPRLTLISAPAQEMPQLSMFGQSAGVRMRGLVSIGVRSGVITTLKNPFTTAFNGVANLISMADAALHGLVTRLPAGPVPPVATRPPMDMQAWEKRLDRMTNEPRVPASVRLRIGGEQFFPDFIQAIQEARESIDIQLYLFDADDYAIQIADLLKARSREVRVRIMIDEFASLHSALEAPDSPQEPEPRPPISIVRYLRSGSKIEVRPMAMPALSANHTKMIIIDGRRAWLGGMNIGREYRSDWHDMMIEVRGPIIGWMQREFVRTWVHNSWTGDLGEFAIRFRTGHKAFAGIPVPPDAIAVRPLRGSAIHSDITKTQFAAIKNAQQAIWLENAYITDSRFIRELVKARHRGVDVRVIVPRENDSPLMKANNKALVPRLLNHGIRVWQLPEMSHVKAAIYDGWACVGSTNFDRLSLRVNREFNIGYSDPAAVDVLRRDLFLKDMARGTEAKASSPGSLASQFTDGLLQAVARQF